MAWDERNDSTLLPLLLAITSVLLVTLTMLLRHGDAAGGEWIVVLALTAAFVVFAVLLPLTRLALRRPRRPLSLGVALAQVGLGLALFVWFVWRFPYASRTGSEAAVLIAVGAGLVGSALVFYALYPRR